MSTFDTKGMTPLMAATFNGNAQIVQFLLDNGANPLAKNVFNGTALSIARVQNNTELISILEPYYPPEPDNSPYVIMYNIILVELEKLGEVLLREASALYADMRVYADALQTELRARWEAYQQQQSKYTTTQDSKQDSPFISEHIVDSNSCSEQSGGRDTGNTDCHHSPTTGTAATTTSTPVQQEEEREHDEI